MTAKKRQGLLLDLPGAPNTPHNVPGYQGYFNPEIPTPVGEEGEISLDVAKEADKDKGVPLKLVDISAGDIKAAEDHAEATVVAGREGQIAANKDGLQGAEKARAQDERNSTKGA